MSDIEKINQLSNQTDQLLALHPSMGMPFTGASDIRIVELAKKHKEPFKLIHNVNENKKTKLILVDPRNWSGFLWWKKSKIIVLSDELIESVKSGQENFDSKTLSFLSNL